MCHATSMGRSVDRTDLLSSIWIWHHLSHLNSFYNTKTAIHFQSFLPHNAAAPPQRAGGWTRGSWSTCTCRITAAMFVHVCVRVCVQSLLGHTINFIVNKITCRDPSVACRHGSCIRENALFLWGSSDTQIVLLQLIEMYWDGSSLPSWNFQNFKSMVYLCLRCIR